MLSWTTFHIGDNIKTDHTLLKAPVSRLNNFFYSPICWKQLDFEVKQKAYGWHVSAAHLASSNSTKANGGPPPLRFFISISRTNDTVFIKHVFHVFAADVRRQVAHVYPTVVTTCRPTNNTSTGHVGIKKVTARQQYRHSRGRVKR